MEGELQRRRRGGQIKAPSERKRNNLTFRARDRLRAALEAEAAENGRSLSEEIEARLEQSLFVQNLLTGTGAIQEASAVKVPTSSEMRFSGSVPGNPLPLSKGSLPGGRTESALEDLIERAVTRALERMGLAGVKPEKDVP